MAKLSRLITCLMWMFLAIFLVCGCDSIIGVESQDASNSSYVALSESPDYVGLTKCYSCHGDAQNDTGCSDVFGESDELKNNGEGWLTGAHGNYESIDEVNNQLIDNATNNNGFPYYDYSGLGTDPTCTTICHDSLGDGELFASFYLQTGIDSLGKVNRPVIGCESCHGDGETHGSIIVGSLPYPNPDASRCGQCHNDNFPEFHLGDHLGGERYEGDRIYEDYLSAPHTESINSHVYVRDSTTEIRAKCARCHTDEGAREYISVVNGLATYDEIGTAMDDDYYPDIDASDLSNVQCRTCHDKHSPLKLLGERATGLPSTWSNEFKTCTSCHQLLKADDTLLTESYHDPDVNSHGDVDEIIPDTHYDDPTTTDIEGYIVDPTSTHSSSSSNTNSGTCRDCHNPHDADNTINIQWAKSAHGGHIYEVKEVDPDGAVTDAEGWVHYDFKTRSGGTCAYCHTTTGFRNFANDPANYDPANNVFVATNEQREMLYCWACHTSNKEHLRDPGSFANTVDYAEPAARISAVPDLAGSNICLVCHSGRKTGQEAIKDKDFATEIDGNHFGSFSPHYLAAGGILFRTIGYEYDSMNYDNKSYFKHDLCGTESAENTGTSGPCVSCHMTTSEPHLFLPVTKDISDQVTEITAQEQCSTCHANLTIAIINAEKDGFENALEALKAQLEAQGIYLGTGYPYFFNSSNPADWTMPNAFTAWPDKDTLGAAFNYSLLGHEPGAYAHNINYTKRLIFDSIDFLDNGTMDGSIDLSSYPAAAEWYR